MLTCTVATYTGYTKYTVQVTRTWLLSQLKCDSPFQMMNWWSEKWICFQLVTHRRNNNSVREKVAGWWMVWTAGSQRSNGVSDWVGYVAVRWKKKRKETGKINTQTKHCQSAEKSLHVWYQANMSLWSIPLSWRYSVYYTFLFFLLKKKILAVSREAYFLLLV